jgi:hypothetical protein
MKLLLPMALSKQCIIYLSNIREIITYHWPKRYNVIEEMTNNNLLYCMIRSQNIRCSS